MSTPSAPAANPSPSPALRWLGRVPLWVQLVVVLLSLAALALGLFGAVAVALLRDQMIDQADQKLREAVAGISQGGRHDMDDRAGRGRFGPNPETVVILTDATGVSISNNVAAAHVVLPALPDQNPATVQSRAGKPFTITASDGHQWRVLMSSVNLANGSLATLNAARDLSDVRSSVRRLTVVCLSAGFLLLLLLAGLGYGLIRAALRPLVQVEHTAAAIASGQLSSRVPARDPRTEVGRLGAAINGMLARIEAAFAAQTVSETAARASEQRMRRFIADASHELRTPLTSISGFTELHGKGGIPDEQVPSVMARLHAEAQRMGLLLEDLLLLARLDQQRPLQREAVDLRALAHDVVQSCSPLAPEHQLRLLEPDEAAAAVIVSADEDRLRQVILNLVTNALRHTPAGSHVQVQVSAADGHATLQVSDDGPGLSGEQASQVFERFYRADPSRTRATGPNGSGNGLGLSIVAAIVAAHAGTVTVESTPGAGATFTVRLPLDCPPSSQQ